VPGKIRLLLADDHPIVRKGLVAAVESEPGFKVIAEAQDGEEALRLIREHKPDVAVLDIDMPKLDGLGVAREVSKLSLGTRIIVLTLHKDADLFRAAIQAGASGYLLKDSAMQEIVAGVKAVFAGQQFVSAALVSLFVEAPKPQSPSPQRDLLASLTPTERQILTLIASGKSSKEIGADLSIHYRTVENHRTNICRKLGIEGAHALLRFALENKLRGQ
jgi:DNA-binding NarL/FixJ family response regulator